jgi:[ribosomal protein S18]-alanine N-acetyltransferase
VAWVWANPEVQGFACAVGAADEVELQSIAVARDHWSRGLGSALMEVLCGWARANKYRTLHLEVREGNVRALEFYGRLGFVRAGRRPRYYRDNGEAALLLVKALRVP